jgi:hypothetical protein
MVSLQQFAATGVGGSLLAARRPALTRAAERGVCGDTPPPFRQEGDGVNSVEGARPIGNKIGAGFVIHHKTGVPVQASDNG